MKLITYLIAGVVSFSATTLFATPDDDRFQTLANDYIEQTLRTHPEQATELGDHRFDDRLTDYSAETRTKELADAKAFREKLNSFGPDAKLSPGNSVDLRILKDNVDYEIFDLEELKDEDWNPLVYNESLANSLYLLVARDFDTPEKRIPNLRKRMEGIPAVIAQAKANLKHSPKVHTETAIDQVQGAVGLVREGLNPLLDQAPKMKKELAPLLEKTALALDEYKKWLKEDLLPRSDGDFRLGMDKFRKKLRFALSSDMSMEDLMKAARTDLEQTLIIVERELRQRAAGRLGVEPQLFGDRERFVAELGLHEAAILARAA
jgi:uncharacterized protein (DUF885 family)